MSKKKNAAGGSTATIESNDVENQNQSVAATATIDPHESNLVAEPEGLQESNAPIPPSATDDSIKIFKDEQAATAGGSVQRIPVARLYRHGNVRTKAVEQIPQMVASLKRHGFKLNHPVVLSAKVKPIDADGHDMLVLCGNRRVLGLEWLALNEPEEFKRILPDGTVPAVVHENLTEEQEALIRVDHGADEDRVALDEFSEFLAVKQLVRAGYATEKGIAEKLGKFTKNSKTGILEPARSWVQPRVNLARMPQYVQDEMQKYCEGRTDGGAHNGRASFFRWSDVMGLAKTFNKEFMDYPNGNGPEFQKAWKAITDRTGDAPASDTQNLSATAAADLAKTVSSRNLREALVAAVKKGRPGFTDIDGRMVRAELAEETLGLIADYLGEAEFTKLVDNAQQAAADKSADSADEAVQS